MTILPDEDRARERRAEIEDERREARGSNIVAILLLGPIFLGTIVLYAPVLLGSIIAPIILVANAAGLVH